MPKPAARGPRDPSRRRRILDAAKQHFTQHGFKGTNLDAVAAAAGCAKGALYLEFPDKQTLLREVVEETFVGVRVRFEAEVLAIASPLERLVGTLRFAYRQMASEPIFGKLLREDPDLRQLLSADPSETRSAAKLEIDRLVGWVDEGITSGEIRPDVDREVIPFVIGVLRFAPQHLGLITHGGLISGERTLEAIVELLRHGLAAHTKPTRRRKQ